MLMADLRRDFVRTWFRPLAELRFEEMDQLYAELEAEGQKLLAQDIEAGGRILFSRGADMRYVGQEHPCHVPLPAHVFASRDSAAIKRAFDEEHLRRYGFDAVKEPAEIVSLTSTVIGLLSKPAAPKLEGRGEAEPARALSQRRPVFFTETGFTETPVYAREMLLPGDTIAGPALVEEHASTTVVFPGDRLTVTGYGDLSITIARS
jgi:N-methylhydantoinase A